MGALSATFISSVLIILLTAPFNLHGQTPTQVQAEDWSISCDKTCRASQLLISKDNKLKYSATLSLADEQNLLQMTLVFPLGIYLPANVALMINDIEKIIPVITCVPSGCNALLVINSELQNEMIKASVFKVRFFTSSSSENEVSYSLKGFKEALALVNQ